MTQIIVTTVILLLLALVGGLLFIAARLALRFPIASIIFSVILVSTSITYYKNFEKKLRLSYVPEGLNVEKVLYANEESWGFGPGGNETGVIVYELPEGVARQIEKSGVNYFTTMPPQTGDSYDWRGRYEKWQRTPISPNWDWSNTNNNGKQSSTRTAPKISNYLNKYGFGISIDANIETEIDSAISATGSYFAYGRIGVLIVVPKTKKVIYLYNG